MNIWQGIFFYIFSEDITRWYDNIVDMWILSHYSFKCIYTYRIIDTIICTSDAAKNQWILRNSELLSKTLSIFLWYIFWSLGRNIERFNFMMWDNIRNFICNSFRYTNMIWYVVYRIWNTKDIEKDNRTSNRSQGKFCIPCSSSNNKIDIMGVNYIRYMRIHAMDRVWVSLFKVRIIKRYIDDRLFPKVLTTKIDHFTIIISELSWLCSIHKVDIILRTIKIFCYNLKIFFSTSHSESCNSVNEYSFFYIFWMFWRSCSPRWKSCSIFLKDTVDISGLRQEKSWNDFLSIYYINLHTQQ